MRHAIRVQDEAGALVGCVDLSLDDRPVIEPGEARLVVRLFIHKLQELPQRHVKNPAVAELVEAVAEHVHKEGVGAVLGAFDQLGTERPE